MATIHGSNDLGRMVKKGEKGIVVFSPVAAKHLELNPAQDASSDNRFRPASVQAAYVFDVSQTYGEPLPEFARTRIDPKKQTEHLKSLIAKRALDPPYAEAVAYAVSSGLALEAEGAALNHTTLYNGDRTTLTRSLALIHEISSQILNELLPEEQPSKRTAALSQRAPLDAEYFSKIQRENGNRLIQSISKFVRDRDRAEEIAARTFQRAWEKRETFRGESKVTTWLEAIARNDARNSRTWERNLQFESIDRDEARELAAPELVTDGLEKRDDRLRLHEALAKLPVKNRRVLTAHFVDGLSIRDIARRQRMPLGTVLSRIHKAKQLLRQAWEDCLTPQRADTSSGYTPSPRPQERQASQAPGANRDRYPESPDPVTWDR